MLRLLGGGTAHVTATQDGRPGSQRPFAVRVGRSLHVGPGLRVQRLCWEMQMPGVERKVLKEVDSNIPGYAKIRVRDVIFQPGSSTPTMTMDNDMVCETTDGP